MKNEIKTNVIFFFGLAGSGKTYLADKLQEMTGWFHYNADDDVTAEMKQALIKHQPFTPKMRDDFFYLIAQKMNQLAKNHPQLIVSQAVYKQQHRDYLQQQLAPLKVQFVHVYVDDETLQNRVNLRGKTGQGIAEKSAQALKQDFECPDVSGLKIDNSKGKNSSVQLTELLGRLN